MLGLLLMLAAGAALYLYEESKKRGTTVQTTIEDAAQEAGQGITTVASDVGQALGNLPILGGFFVSGAIARKLAVAIGYAEGGYDLQGNNRNNGTRPSRNHNPGDLKGNFAGTAIGDDSGFDVYPDDATGWAALIRQAGLWLTNRSTVAGREDTIGSLATKYTTTEQNSWSRNVAAALGVSTDTQLGDLSA
jgi:hypothetical protein